MFIRRVWSTGISVIIHDKLINPSGAVPIQVTNIPKLLPLEVVEAWYTNAPCIVLNPERKIPPQVKLINAINKLGE